MKHAERLIVEAYSNMFENLSSVSKLELLDNLKKSLEKDSFSNEDNFFKSFGAFASDKSPEELIKEIKESRKFREKDFNL